MTTIEKPTLENYESRLVAFVDLLGFERLVSEVDKGGDSFDRLRTERDGVLEKYIWLRDYIDSLIRENKCPAAEVAITPLLPQLRIMHTSFRFSLNAYGTGCF